MERQAKDGTVYQQVGPDQWTPVTRTAKDGTTYKKVGEDAWTPLAEVKTEKAKRSNKVEAALEGFGEGATLGYLNNLQALAEKPIFAALNAVTGQDVKSDDYVTARDSYNKRQEQLKEENPKSFAAGQVAGTVASSLPVAKAAQGATVLARAGKAAKAGAAYGALQNTTEQEGEAGDLNLGERAKNAASGAAIGAGASLGADAISKAAKYASSAKSAAGNSFKKAAEDLAENATGATGRQSEKFRDGTGRYLLDNKLVRFGDTAENVAERAGDAIKKAESSIDASLKSLDAKGVQVSQDKIIQEIQSKITDLSKDPSKADVVRKLNSIVDDIIETGNSNISASSAEQAKRGFNKMAKNWQDPEKGQAGKIAYRAYRDAVEETAQASDKAIAQTFKEGKETFGRLAPVVDAAEKRAAQLNQSPIGGLLDVAGTAAGGTVAGIPGAVVGGMARRAISPRISSSLAVTFDNVSKRLLQNPQMSRLSQADPQAFRAAVFSAMEGLSERSPGMALPKAANNDRPTKGPEKWVLDGIDKLNQAGVSADEIETLRSSKRGRDLLIEASGASPNSKRMEGILKRIRTSSAGGGE